jgi:hypothetical protein
MKAKPRPGLVIFLAVFTVVLAVALPALAYQYPLSSTDIRNAYMLGTRKDSLTTEFFAPYRHDLPMPRSGPHVADITIETPYSQVVELGQSAQNPDTQGAEQDLAKKKLPFLVRVGVDLTDTYPGPSPSNLPAFAVALPDFQRDFKIQMMQNDKKIAADSSQVYLLYSDYVSNLYQISGALIEVRYENEIIDPYSEITITVQTPDSQNVETAFNLGRLK